MVQLASKVPLGLMEQLGLTEQLVLPLENRGYVNQIIFIGTILVKNGELETMMGIGVFILDVEQQHRCVVLQLV